MRVTVIYKLFEPNLRVFAKAKFAPAAQVALYPSPLLSNLPPSPPMVAWSGLAGSDAYDVLGMGISCIDNADEVAAAAAAHRRRVINAACCAAEAIAEANKAAQRAAGPEAQGRRALFVG